MLTREVMRFLAPAQRYVMRFVGKPKDLVSCRLNEVIASGAKMEVMSPPEVVLDRFVRGTLRHEPGCSGYVGKLDIDRLESPLREFLHQIQQTMNDELLSEGVNASGGAKHPPFHFDYIEVSNGVQNAHAFQNDGYAFIVVTSPLLESIGNLSHRLSSSQALRELLGIQSLDAGELQELLFHIQLHFLVSHEYAHHIRHHPTVLTIRTGLWTEFDLDATDGSMKPQAQELDADGYASYLVLAHILRGGGRAALLEQLGRREAADGNDELLLQLFFLAVFAFFCELWRAGIDMSSVRQFTHPPPPVRITYTIRVAQMWCSQDQSVPTSWFDDKRFQKLFSVAAKVISEVTRVAWDPQMRFFSSSEGLRYDTELLEAFTAVRQGREGEPELVKTTS